MTDPIILVVTPRSMGKTPSSLLFWSVAVSTSMQFEGYDATVALMKAHGVYQWVAYLMNSQSVYLSKLSEVRTNLVSLTIGTVMILVVSVALFILINHLYFEEHRREIFIKRISGLSFLHIHGPYLLIQETVLVLATLAMAYLMKWSGLAFAMGGVYLVLTLVVMWQQSLREDGASVTLLKGE